MQLVRVLLLACRLFINAQCAVASLIVLLFWYFCVFGGGPAFHRLSLPRFVWPFLARHALFLCLAVSFVAAAVPFPAGVRLSNLTIGRERHHVTVPR